MSMRCWRGSASASHFDGVFDIIAAEFEPKPAAQTYQKFLERHAVDPTKAAMFEDLARNLTVPHELGMTTVLVVPDGTKEVVREDWELEGRDAAHVDHVTDDLAGFLAGCRPSSCRPREGRVIQNLAADSSNPRLPWLWVTRFARDDTEYA